MTTVASPAAREHVTDMTYPISPEYVKNWTAERGIAEFIANAIDADPTGYSVTYTDGVLTIEDFAVDGVGSEGMILGYTSKSNDGTAIGQFGEGAKIASLVLARDSNIKNMYVETVGYAFEPVITDYLAVAGLDIPNKTSAVPQVLTWRLFRSDRKRGTKVTIECPQAIAVDAMDRFLHLSVKDYVRPSGAGQIVRGGKPGRFYIGGVFVTEQKNLMFSYDLGLTHKAAQNRDRSVIESWVLTNAVSAILQESLDVEVLSAMIKRVLDPAAKPLAEIEQSFINAPANTPALRAMWTVVANRVLGEGKFFYSEIRANNETLLDLADRGFTQVAVPGLSGWRVQTLMALLGVPAAGSLAKKVLTERAHDTTYVKEDTLTAEQVGALAYTVRIIRAIHGPDSIDKARVFSKTVADGSACHWAGFYKPSNGEIAVHVSVLTDPDALMDTLLHETAHRIAHRFYLTVGLKYADYNDRSRGFEHTLGVMMRRTVKAFASGQDVESLEAGWAAADPTAGMQSLPGGMRWSGNDRAAKPVPCTAEAAAATVRTAISAYGTRNGIPDAKVPVALSKAPMFLDSALVRALRDGKPNATVKYVRIAEVVTVLGMPPEAAAALWWGMVGGAGTYTYKTLTAKSRRFSVKLIPAAEVACEALSALGGEYADLAVELLMLAHGEAKVDQDNADWQAPIVRLVALATASAGTAAGA